MNSQNSTQKKILFSVSRTYRGEDTYTINTAYRIGGPLSKTEDFTIRLYTNSFLARLFRGLKSSDHLVEFVSFPFFRNHVFTTYTNWEIQQNFNYVRLYCAWRTMIKVHGRGSRLLWLFKSIVNSERYEAELMNLTLHNTTHPGSALNATAIE